MANPNLSYRSFIFENVSIKHISQKKLNDFYLKDLPVLPEYADREINLALVIYSIADGMPDQVVRIDTQRVKVNEQGGVDTDNRSKGIHYAINQIGNSDKPKKHSAVGSVIDASDIFEKKQWERNHPELPGPVHKLILKALFKTAI